MPRARDRTIPSVEPAGIAYRLRSRRLVEVEDQRNIGNSRRRQPQAAKEERQRQDAEQQISVQQPVEQRIPGHTEVQTQRVQNNFAFLMKIFGLLVLITNISTTIAGLCYWISERCETSCTERWNNLHRRNPLDFKTWKKILCPFLVENNCTYPLRITLIDISENFISYNQNELWVSNSKYDSYFLYANFKQCASEYQIYKKENKEIEYFFHDSSTRAVQRNHKLRNTSSPYLSLFKKDSKYRSETVRKQSTIFSIRHFIENQELLIRALVFHLFGANKSDSFPPMVLGELLTFVTAIDFKTGCYEFSNISPLQENLSIEQTFFGRKTYVSDDGMTYLRDWILLRFSVYFLFLFIAYTVWGLTRQMLTLENMYSFCCKFPKASEKYHTLVWSPSLISTKKTLADYFLKIACFRKFYSVGSSYIIACALFSFVRTFLYIFFSVDEIILLIYLNEGFLSGLYLLIVFLTFTLELIDNKFELPIRNKIRIPEPTEAFTSMIPISSLFWNMQVLQNKLISCVSEDFFENMKKKYSACKIIFKLIFLTLNLFIFYRIYIGAFFKSNSCLCLALFGLFTTVYYCSFYTICNMTFRFVLWYYLMIIIYPILYLNLQLITFYYFTNVPVIYSNKIWIPFIFLLLSYLKDVFIEYYQMYSIFFKRVLVYIESHCINDDDMTHWFLNSADNADNPIEMAVLARKANQNAPYCLRETYRTHSGVMLFYNNYGNRSVTSNFVCKINKILGLSFHKVIGTIWSEISSLIFRMLPAGLTFWVFKRYL